jgi:SAM-dependent methyltransferase
MPMSQPYHSLEAELHDAFWDAEDEGSELVLMTDFLKHHPGPALEIGSGSGRLMFPLCQQGFDLEGLELSDDMRALGRIRAEKLGVNAMVHAGDMTDWRPPRRYAALLATAFTLQLAADPAAVLRHWHTWLENHGGLYLTVFMPLAELSGDLPEHAWYPDHQAVLPDGRQGLLETRHRIDHQARIIHRQHRYSLAAGKGKPACHYESKQAIRWIEHHEMLTLLAQSGFLLQRFHLDFDPAHTHSDPDPREWDGIVTYRAIRLNQTG